MMHKNLFAVFAIALSLIFVGGSTAETRPSLQKTQEIVFGAFNNYDHKSGWFSMAVPANWKVTDKGGEGELIVSIIDPTGNAVVVVRVYQPSKGRTQSELGEVLKTFLSDRMGSFDGFSMGELRSQRDRSMGLYFKYNSTVDGVNYKMYGDAFIEQHNGLIGVLALIMPQDQYEAKQKAAYEMVNSFHVTGTAP